MTELSNEYSGSLQQGWNTAGSYDRLQYFSTEISSEKDFIETINQGLALLEKSDNTRLDIRTAVSDDFDISYIFNQYPYNELSIRKSNGTNMLTFGLNIGERKLSEKEVRKVQNHISDKVQTILYDIDQYGGFESYAKNILNNSVQRGFSFEANNFGVEEVYNLWGYNFGWSRSEIEAFINNNIGTDSIFGLRNETGELIALLMIGDDYETTEWSVAKQYQGTGVIEPLLIAVNALYIEKGQGENVYAHMRWNRSIGPGLKSGLRVSDNKYLDNILTNLVEVEGEMQHFLEGGLDTSLYSQELLEYIKNFRN